MSWHPRNTDQIALDVANLNSIDFLTTRVGVVITQVKGLVDQPNIRVTNRDRPGKPGQRAGGLSLSGRPFTMEGYVFGNGMDDLEERKADFQDVLVPDGIMKPFYFTHQSRGAQQVSARVEQELIWGDPFELGDVGPQVGIGFIVGLTAHDPRRYAQSLQTAQSTSIATGGGFTFPMTFPLSFGAAASGGTIDIPASAGNTDRPATIRLYGPVTNPIIEDISGRWLLNFQGNGGLVLTTSDYVDIDLDEETVFLNGDPLQSRYGYIDFTVSNFANLPATACTLRYRGSVITDPAYAIASWRDATV